ncbi:DUF3793 family protein [Lachnospiraceae bacterium MD1]|uniref:DUF3793 family protein n=1 Tax=Variimorphobacter saccharofermentans TaxID=2755051 RepID=A0A839K2R2_9FIRM|nr:DUF3793 family protein [Variimorphobacter saccharofermentans]MBB2183910.1 DUF3793 family protein [Variimorphobacter saccharofermentans]
MSGSLYHTSIEKLQLYSTRLLANHCVPTLIGVKPACFVNTRSYFSGCKDGVLKSIRIQLEHFSCRCDVLYETNRNYMLFIYNPSILQGTLTSNENRKFLCEYGYCFEGDILKECIRTLRDRYQGYMISGREFPHEIGIFLGYPCRDVKAFIRKCGKDYIACGAWKVYYDVDYAQQVFYLYQKLRKDTLDALHRGKSLIDAVGSSM